MQIEQNEVLQYWNAVYLAPVLVNYAVGKSGMRVTGAMHTLTPSSSPSPRSLGGAGMGIDALTTDTVTSQRPMHSRG